LENTRKKKSIVGLTGFLKYTGKLREGNGKSEAKIQPAGSLGRRVAYLEN